MIEYKITMKDKFVFNYSANNILEAIAIVLEHSNTYRLKDIIKIERKLKK